MAEQTLARRTGSLALGQMAVKGSQVVLTVILVRMLAPDDWSRVAYLLSIHLAATTLGTLNLHQSLLFFLPRLSERGRRTLVLSTASTMLGIGAVIALGLTAAAPWISGGRLDVGGWLPWLGLAIALELPTACAPTLLLALDRVRAASLWDAAGAVVLIVSLVTVVAAGWGVGGIVTALAVVAGARLAAMLALIHRTYPGRGEALPHALIRQQITFSIPLGLTIGASVMNRTVDKWFVAALDPGDLGVYTIAAQEIPLLAVLPVAGGAAMVAHLVDAFQRQDLSLARDLWNHQTALMSRIVVPISAGLILASPELFPMVFSPAMQAGVVPFQVFTAITLHRVAEYGVLLRAAGRTRDLLTAAVVLLGSNVVLAGLGAVLWGMTGAALGTLAANAVAWWLVLGRIAQALGTARRASFCWGTWLRCVVAAIAAAVTAWTLAGLLATTTWDALVIKAIVFVALVVAMDPWAKEAS